MLQQIVYLLVHRNTQRKRLNPLILEKTLQQALEKRKMGINL